GPFEDLQLGVVARPFAVAEQHRAAAQPRVEDGPPQLLLREVEGAGVEPAGGDLDVEGHRGGRRYRLGMMRAMPPQRPDTVLFDNDGLLLDTESVWTRAEQDMFDAYGQEFTPAHKRELIGKSGAIASKLLEGWLAQDGRGVELMAELDQMVVAELEHGVEAMVGARDLLERLQAQGTP